MMTELPQQLGTALLQTATQTATETGTAIGSGPTFDWPLLALLGIAGVVTVSVLWLMTRKSGSSG